MALLWAHQFIHSCLVPINSSIVKDFLNKNSGTGKFVNKLITSVCTYNPPTLPPNPNPSAPRPQPSNPHVRKLLIYGQIMLVNKFYYSYLHMKFGVVFPVYVLTIKPAHCRHPFFWSQRNEMKFLAAVGKQPEIRSG